MEVGYFAVGIGPTADPERVRTVATNAERLGFSTVWAPEHVVLLDEYTSKYPYSSGKFPAPPAQALGDRPLRQLARIPQPQNFSDLAHRQSLGWHPILPL